MPTKTKSRPKKKNALIAALTTKDTRTENGALSHSTTGTSVLDFFGKGGAMRASSTAEIESLFASAYAEDKTVALKVLFYLSDVREGQGERRLFRTAFNWLARNDLGVAQKLIKQIAEFTRFDNVLESLEGTPLEKDALSYIGAQLKADLKNGTPTLCAKWAPSEQASSDTTRRLARKMRETMKLSPKQYRKLLSGLRARIGVVERQMCANEWTEIDYQAVPSNASTLYRKAFKRHDTKGYESFLKKVEKGEAKINASVLYPYDIVRQVRQNGFGSDQTLSLQWKALPDYLAENPHNGLVVADTSGSMAMGDGLPIDVAISLAIYFAERNVGAFKDYFAIFSATAKLLKLSGSTIQSKALDVFNKSEVANTNLQSIFDLILDRAVSNKVPEKDMPKVIYLISDMQFDNPLAVADPELTNLEVIRAKYKRSGYALPKIVFWNVRAAGDTPITVNDKGVCLVSGCSPTILKTVLTGKVMTPWDVMLNTVNVERYKAIKA